MTMTRTPDHPPVPAPEGTDPDRGNRGGRLTGMTVRLTAGGYVLAIFALVVSGLSLRAVAPGQPAAAYLAAAAALAALLLGSLVLHELGHALSARRQGIRAGEISVGLFGATGHGSPDLANPRVQWRVAAAGPATSLALAGVTGAATASVAALGVDGLAVPVLAIAALANAVLGVLSLLPGAGPDGGRIVRALTWARTGDPAKAGIVAARTGQVTGAVLAAAALAVIALGYTAGLWLAVIGILAFVTSRSEARQLLTAAALTGLRVGDVVPLSTSPQAGVQAWQTVQAFVAGQATGGTAETQDIAGPGTAQGPAGQTGSAATAFPLVSFDGRPAGLLTLSQLAAVPADQYDTVRLRDIATPLAQVVTATADEPVAGLLGRLSAWPRTPAAVHTAGHALVLGPDRMLAGVVTPADLARATQLGALRQRTRPSGAAAAAPR
jgi:Zn-dependent protease